ncbi:kinase-like domain-containing protein [Mycena galericulata]|nr:kinase-like domain-containing protein [Mycena galericulata]
MADEDNPVQLCTGNNTCLRHFEYKNSPGRCHKCVLLANSPDTEHARIFGIPQCVGCGNVSDRLTTDYCGLCDNKNKRRLVNPVTNGPSMTQGDTSSVRNLGQFHRQIWKDAAHINDSSIRTQKSTVPMTPGNLATLRSNNLATNECYVFILEPFVNSKPCAFLSTFEVIREATIKLSDMAANGIMSFNSSWEQDSEASLVRSDIRFSRMNNTGQNLDKTAPTKFRNRKFPTVYIEAHIDLQKFGERTGVAPPRALFKPKKRVWDENMLTNPTSSLLKRSRLASGASTLKSSFTLVAPMSEATTVTLFFAEQIADPATGVQTIEWSSVPLVPHTVQIENHSSNKGKSKLVFKVNIDGKPYVAKRCYTIGYGPVSILDNHKELVKEGVTLGRSKFLLANFKLACEEEDVDISICHELANGWPEFEVTDFILAREGTAAANDGSEQPTFIPSPASGITAAAYSALSDEAKKEMIVPGSIVSSLTWLLEPERGNVYYRKYSGTLEHPRHTDKQGSTINALQHFAYLNSNKSLILADIQASESHIPSSKASVLFDLMSHTTTGDSGAGDHGEDGIKTFIEHHQCGQRCMQLGLELLNEKNDEE